MIGGLLILMLAANSTIGTGQAIDWADRPTANVRTAAKHGDRRAALELGKRYEAGRGGLSCDWRAARHWYGFAARDGVNRRLFYSPPVGGETYGRAIDLGTTTTIPGLIEAKRRLVALPRGRCAKS